MSLCLKAALGQRLDHYRAAAAKAIAGNLNSSLRPKVFGCPRFWLYINDVFDYNDSIYQRLNLETLRGQDMKNEEEDSAAPFFGLGKKRKTRKRSKKFTEGPESERIQKLLKYCRPHLTPKEESFLQRIKSHPQWEDEFEDIDDFEGVKWLISGEKDDYISILEQQLEAREAQIEEPYSIEEQRPCLSNSEEAVPQGITPPDPALKSDGNVSSDNIGETAPGGSISKKLISVRLPVDLIERVRDVVYHTPEITMCDFAEDAFRKAMVLLEQSRGEPFPKRIGEIKKGRPMR